MIALRLRLPPDRPVAVDLLRCALVNAGADRRKIVEETRKGVTALRVFLPSLNAARRLQRTLAAAGIKGVRSTIERIKDRRWQTRWKQFLRPFSITPAVYLVPWHRRSCRVPAGKKRVLIDTTFAFGTGLHPTTRLMAGLLHALRGKYRSLLDVGTGSGILAILGHCYGARRIRALDADVQSVTAAGRNFRLNRCRIVRCRKADFARTRIPSAGFDLVAANLLTDDLIRMKDRLCACVRPGGYLAVSGIFRDNYRRFRRGFRVAGLRCVRVCRRKDWYAVLFRKGKAHG